MNQEHGRLIELIAQWEGRVNATTLQKHFDISRATATKSLQNYCKHYPDNIRYDSTLKGYLPNPHFTPQHCLGTIEEYSQLHLQHELPNPFHFIEAPIRNIDPSLTRPLFQAIRNKRRLDIGYASVSSPDYEGRIISPHSVVFTDIRWHVRAYCEKNQDFRDFVISRLNGVFNDEGEAIYHEEHDKKWNTFVDVVIEPDPRLNPSRKRIIELDYQMESGQKTLKTRAALLMYLLQKLRLDQYKPTGQAQQIIVNSDCWKQIEQYLPK